MIAVALKRTFIQMPLIGLAFGCAYIGFELFGIRPAHGGDVRVQVTPDTGMTLSSWQLLASAIGLWVLSVVASVLLLKSFSWFEAKDEPLSL